MGRRRVSAGGRLGALTVLVLASTVLCAAGAQDARAFKAGAHWALAMKVARSLPAEDRVRRAMLAQPDCVAWGSNGPDLAGCLPGMASDRVPWFDTYHYHSVGRFCRQLMQDALESGDDRQIAFAAGWVTHVVGDMSVHGIVVNPEAGVYIDRGSDADLHGDLESWTDPVVWTDIAGLDAQDYLPYTSRTSDRESTKLYRRFVAGQGLGDALTVPADGCLEDLVDRVNHEVVLDPDAPWGGFTYLQNTDGAATGFGLPDYFGPSNMRIAERVFAEVLALEGDAFLQDPYAWLVNDLRANKIKLYRGIAESRVGLQSTGTAYQSGRPLTAARIERVKRAWAQSCEYGRRLLEDASRGDYTAYSPAWVADAGLNDGRGIGSLRLTIRTGTASGAGTDHNVYFGMRYDTGFSQEWRLDNAGNSYNDFENGDRDAYYVHNYQAPGPWRVDKIWIRLGSDGPISDELSATWDLWAFAVFLDDTCFFSSSGWDHWTDQGTGRYSWVGGAQGLDRLDVAGWPLTPTAAVQPSARRYRWVTPDAATASFVSPGRTVLDVVCANPDNLQNPRFTLTRGVVSRVVPAEQGSGTDWCHFRAVWPADFAPAAATVSFSADDGFGEHAAPAAGALVDSAGPTTRALNAPRVRKGRTATIRYRVDDPSPSCGRAVVRVELRSRAGRLLKTLPAAVGTVNAAHSLRWRCTLAPGRYRLVVRATDVAGNPQRKAGSAALTVTR